MFIKGTIVLHHGTKGINKPVALIIKGKKMKIDIINGSTIKEFDLIKAGRYRPALIELYTFMYLKRRYDVVVEHGCFDFICINFDKREVHIYEVKGKFGLFSKMQVQNLINLLKTQKIRVFLVYPERIMNNCCDVIETPLGYLFIFEIKQENYTKILQKIGIKSKNYEF